MKSVGMTAIVAICVACVLGIGAALGVAMRQDERADARALRDHDALVRCLARSPEVERRGGDQ